ncbi:unnamed protein product [Caenorhabditis sp. 36 PRJEB53466]|nr:unnamed protein product [Caenorhabditis sp. 36 PRJEB53466]
MIFNGSNSDNRNVRTQISNNRQSIKYSNHETTSEVPGYLQLYLKPPGDEISLLEFDEIAMERLQLLKTLEICKDSHPLHSEEFKTKFRKMCSECKLIIFPDQKSPDPVDVAERWRRDEQGHFILRLAFCRSPENQKWLTQIEGDLFRFRLRQEKPHVVDSALYTCKMSIDRLSTKEKKDMEELLAYGCTLHVNDVQSRTFYKVDFVDATDLMRRGHVYLKKGLAYFPFDDLVLILATKMKNNMMAAMARSFKHLAYLEEEGRLLPRLALLANNAYNGKEYTGQQTDGAPVVTRHVIDKLVARSFPPCMKQMHKHLRLNHHLKYGARRQYGLFLKGIGLSLEEALAMMREEFTKKMTADKFEKEYGYNIRYMYGKEGRRVAQTAMSCASIILRNPPSAVDCHGCPFRHSEPPVLRQKLGSESVLHKDHVQKILELSEAKQYDKACTRYFEFTHKLEEGALGTLITHPNQFYEESQKIVAERIAAKLSTLQPKQEKMDTQ